MDNKKFVNHKKIADKKSADKKIKVGLLGYGAIGRPVAAALLDGQVGNARLSAVLVQDIAKHTDRSLVDRDATVCFTDDVETFFACGFDLLVEAAGQTAVRQYGRRCLQMGADFLVTSIGAFTDDAFYQALQSIAAATGGQLLLASGALPGIDWMQSAALSGDCQVAITQTKPLASWRGTPAEEMVDLDQISEPTRFFAGTAREAAGQFVKSSNITALLALATAGLDQTHVRLVANPLSTSIQTVIEFKSAAGNLWVELQGIPASRNPSTSIAVPLSVIKAIRNLVSAVHLGA